MTNRWLAGGVFSAIVLVGGFTVFKMGAWWANRQPSSANANATANASANHSGNPLERPASKLEFAGSPVTPSPSYKPAPTASTSKRPTPTVAAATQPNLNPAAQKVFIAASPAVVRVQVRDASLKPTSQCSGFFVSADGFLITNFQVIAGANLASVQTSDGRILFVEGVAAKDEEADLALLKVRGTKLPFLKLAESPTPKVGTRIYAIGNPQGATNTLSEGLLSGVHEMKKGLNIIQTSVPTSPGSSGGPLLTSDATVIGVTTATLPGGQSLNLAVPAERVRAMLSGKQPLAASATGANDALDPKDALAFSQLFLALDRGQLNQASLILTSLRTRESTNPIYFFLDGTLQAMMNNLDLAANSFRQAIQLKPDMSLAHDGLGHVLKDQGKLREAVDAYRSAAKIDPSNWLAYQNAGIACAMLGEQEKALAYFDRAIKLQPTRAHLQRYRAQALADLGRNIDAFQAFDAALKLDPKDASTYTSIGALHLKLKRTSMARSALLKAVSLDAGDARAFLLLGEAAFTDKDLKTARAAWLDASRLEPNGPIGDAARKKLQYVADVNVNR